MFSTFWVSKLLGGQLREDDDRNGWGQRGRVQRKGIPMTILAIRNAVGPYNPFARSLIIEARSSRYAGIYATAYSPISKNITKRRREKGCTMNDMKAEPKNNALRTFWMFSWE
jgi:hypothetical protein